MATEDKFGAEAQLKTGSGEYTYYSLPALGKKLGKDFSKLPYSIRVLLESCLRNLDDFIVSEEDVKNIANWDAKNVQQVEIPFTPGRVVLQDFTGVPAVVDLAALRAAMVRMGGDPKKINPLVQCDLVIDHSVQVDAFASKFALQKNVEIEFERNKERYQFLRWGQQAFNNFRVVPPATGIVHQVNLEYLANGTLVKDGVVYPDSLVGTDSHTTMINGLGVVGWGVGGIEAEAVMLGQPIYMLLPEVVGFKLTGKLPEGATATDLVLTVTQMLRKHGVVGKFVEYFGPGLESMSLPDRATLANMAPEYGATMGFFPVDKETVQYLLRTGRDPQAAELMEDYFKAQEMFHTADSPDPEFTSTLELDLSTVVPSMAGPKRPQDRILLTDMKSQFEKDLKETFNKPKMTDPVSIEGMNGDKITDGAVVIAAITSCTNTSNPSVLIAAGLVAQKAAAKGLKPKPWVKTSLAPGSRVVTEYLEKSGLDKSLDELGFQTVGYGCTTCIGNSGPLPEPIANAIVKGDLVATSVLSGNRNFEGRINQHVKANYLASPPLVVAYAIAGTTDLDLATEPLGQDEAGNDVFLKDIWPSADEVQEVIDSSISRDQFIKQYATVFDGDERWTSLPTPEGPIFEWDDNSTYVRKAPYFEGMSMDLTPVSDIHGARVMATLGDSVTTDHISPAGNIKAGTPAAQYLTEHGAAQKDFN
ncbi:MAG: aconitate hydratase AcnA, partial [Planctomycetaceae bacterium]|nr:aconitate hydratase AcnA [Planctomycetaceae bacterium]